MEAVFRLLFVHANICLLFTIPRDIIQKKRTKGNYFMQCGLSIEINHCPYFDKTKTECHYKEKCSYQERPEKNMPYVRKERWYEKYYRK